MRSERNPPLGIPGFVYADLYDVTRLEALAVEFDRFAAIRDSGLFRRFEAYRQAMVAGAAHGGLTTPVESELLIQVGRELGVFLTKLFAIEPEAELLRVAAINGETKPKASAREKAKKPVASRAAQHQPTLIHRGTKIGSRPQVLTLAR